MDKARILAAANSTLRCRIYDLELLGAVDSTNSHTLRRIQNGELKLPAGAYYACLAERQTQGKGRRGRSWISPAGQNIYLTLARELDAGHKGLEGMSLAVGLAAARTLKSFGIAGVGLKWPNDIIHQHRKLAGILLEVAGDPSAACQVVIGIGLNVRCDPGEMEEIRQPWTDLAGIGAAAWDRDQLAGRLIADIVAILDEFVVDGFEKFLDEWNSLDAMKGRMANLPTSAGSCEGAAEQGLVGKCLGVNAKGQLLLETDEGVRCFSGGELI